VTRPAVLPIGLDLARTAKSCGRAFDDALAEAGGSAPVWQILISIKSGQHGNQRALAESVGIQGATLTHHLNAMEADGLVTRRRDPANRRVQHVELTAAGEELFDRLRTAAVAFDRRLRGDLSAEEVAELGRLLARLRDNVG
jgi:MarR family transcriptional regulator, transcriptional regulator for hemolysin